MSDLPSPHLSYSPHLSTRLLLERLQYNFTLGTSVQIFQLNPNLDKFEQQYRALYVKNCVSFIVAMVEQVQILCERATMLLYTYVARY